MSSQANNINFLREENPVVAEIIDAYEEIERIYRDALQAMSAGSRQISVVQNSADVTLSFNSKNLFAGQ